MKNLRCFYNIFQLVKQGDEVIREDYVETKEFGGEDEAEIMGYLEKLKKTTGEEYTAHVTMLLVKDNKWKGKNHGKRYREK